VSRQRDFERALAQAEYEHRQRVKSIEAFAEAAKQAYIMEHGEISHRLFLAKVEALKAER
jgi:hypothetical protein